jgi:asparagine synthase (glutamine-hydrolysing)
VSGLCGLVRLDGGAASEEQLAPIWSALAHRGPDGGSCWSGGAAALGFRLLATTPEAKLEQLPLRHAASGHVIVADARLDNREELAAALGTDQRGKGDGELILLAHLKWGDEARLHLLGDFAYAIWDERRQRLVCVRDPVGMRQLHYAHLPGKLFAFATDEQALLRHPHIPVRLNEVRVADFLADLEGADLTSTFHVDVLRLPPAHRLTLEGSRLQLGRYWSLEPPEILWLRSDEEYEGALLSVFRQAVSARLRGDGPVGAMLSGGLDSSSVVAVASQLPGGPLPVFSAVDGEEQPGKETQMIRRVQSLAGLLPFEVTPAGEVADENLLTDLAGSNPFDGHMSLLAAVYALASRQGCKVVLDGVSADVVLAHRNVGARLLRSNRWRDAWAYSTEQHAFWGGGPIPAVVFLGALRAAYLPDWARMARRNADRALRWIAPRERLARSDFARRVDLAGRYDLFARSSPSPRLPYAHDRALGVTHPNLVVARERYDRVAARSGVEPRDPFLDLRLIRLALSLPPEQLVRNGTTKHILRRAMKGLLPGDVRWRRGKEHLGPQFTRAALHRQWGAWSAVLQEEASVLQRWVRGEGLKAAGLSSELNTRSELHAIGHLALWLSARAERGL